MKKKVSLKNFFKVYLATQPSHPCQQMTLVSHNNPNATSSIFLITFLIVLLSTICTNISFEKLVDHNVLVGEDGIINDSEELPVSVFDITDDELQNLQKYFTTKAYMAICQAGEFYITLGNS